MPIKPHTHLDTKIPAKHHDNKDAALIARIAKGDEAALEQLYHGYYNRLIRFITHLNGHVDRMDEIINEVMYVVWQKAETYNHNCRPSTWIFGIAYNKVRKSFKLSRIEQCESLDSMAFENPLFGRDDPAIKNLEMKNWFETALAALSLEQRTVVELTYFQGLHYSEIAELMGCPENTVKTRMHHARKKLAPILLKLENSDLMTGDKQ